MGKKYNGFYYKCAIYSCKFLVRFSVGYLYEVGSYKCFPRRKFNEATDRCGKNELSNEFPKFYSVRKFGALAFFHFFILYTDQHNKKQKMKPSYKLECVKMKFNLFLVTRNKIPLLDYDVQNLFYLAYLSLLKCELDTQKPIKK